MATATQVGSASQNGVHVAVSQVTNAWLLMFVNGCVEHTLPYVGGEPFPPQMAAEYDTVQYEDAGGGKGEGGDGEAGGGNSGGERGAGGDGEADGGGGDGEADGGGGGGKGDGGGGEGEADGGGGEVEADGGGGDGGSGKDGNQLFCQMDH